VFPLACILFISLPLSAYGQFQAERNYAGSAIGLSFLGATPEFGLNFEHGMKMDFGAVGIGGLFLYHGVNPALFVRHFKEIP